MPSRIDIITVQNKINEHLNKARKAFNKGNYSEALDELTQAIELNPRSSDAYYHIGLVYNKFGDLYKAIKYYNKAIEINNYHSSAYSNRGLLYSEIGELDKAIEDYETVLELNPINSKAHNNFGYLLRIKGDYPEAIKELKISIEQNTKDEQAYNNLGSVYNDIGYINNNEKNDFDKAEINFKKAISNFQEAIKLDKKYEVAFNNLGGAYTGMLLVTINKYKKKIIPNEQFSKYEEEYYNKALKNVTKAINIKLDYKNAYKNRSEIYRFKQEFVKAQIDIDMVETLPDNRLDSKTDSDEFNIIRTFAKTIKDLEDPLELNAQYLYKYKNIDENTMSALSEESIWVASPKTFNDPLDGSYLYNKIDDPLFNQELDGIGIISFEGNEAEKGGLNTLIWSHYADAHKGICLIYKRIETQSRLREDAILKMQYNDDISLALDTTEEMIKTGFQTKHSSWEYEKEYRLILHKVGLGDGYLAKTQELGLSLEGIIFGLKCSQSEEAMIKKLLKKQDIKYYKIKQEVKHRVTKHLKLEK